MPIQRDLWDKTPNRAGTVRGQDRHRALTGAKAAASTEGEVRMRTTLFHSTGQGRGGERNSSSAATECRKRTVPGRRPSTLQSPYCLSTNSGTAQGRPPALMGHAVESTLRESQATGSGPMAPLMPPCLKIQIMTPQSSKLMFYHLLEDFVKYVYKHRNSHIILL